MAEPTRPPTRPLDLAERALLDHLLTPNFKGVETLRAQAAQAETVMWDEFLYHIKLYVPPGAPPASDVYRNPVTIASTAIEHGPGAVITLWLDGDYLDYIHLGWLEGPWPDLPSLSQLDYATLM